MLNDNLKEFAEFFDEFTQIIQTVLPFMLPLLIISITTSSIKWAINIIKGESYEVRFTDRKRYTASDIEAYIGDSITDTVDNILSSEREDANELIEWYSEHMFDKEV